MISKDLLDARYATYVPVFSEQTRTAAQREGLRYEAAVMRKLALTGLKIETGPWLYYKTAKKSGVCQPDALVWLNPKLICIVEVKLSWMRPARAKLLGFYGPIVQAIYPKAQICYCQIYKRSKKGCHKCPITIYTLESESFRTRPYRELQLLT